MDQNNTLDSQVRVFDSPPVTCKENVPFKGAKNDPCHTISHSKSLKGSTNPF